MSIALPGSIVDNAQSAELRTYLAGQIGRALAVFNIDEIVIFRDDSKHEGVCSCVCVRARVCVRVWARESVSQ